MSDEQRAEPAQLLKTALDSFDAWIHQLGGRTNIEFSYRSEKGFYVTIHAVKKPGPYKDSESESDPK